MNLEQKEFTFEIKEIDDKGYFKGIACPYNEVDLGNDRVLPSIASRNNNKTVPFLWQHDTHEPIGSLLLKATDKGIEVDGSLILDTNEQGIPCVPNSLKAHALMKKGILKMSIGYNTLKYNYDDKGVRNLEDIDIMEVSAVTFPMNPRAKFTSVKEVNNNLEAKNVFEDIVNQRTARQKIRDIDKFLGAFYESMRTVMNNSDMDNQAKLQEFQNSLNSFNAMVTSVFNEFITLNAEQKSEILEVLETKNLEIKAGKKVNKQNTEIIKNTIDMLKKLLDDTTDKSNEESGDDTEKGKNKDTQKKESDEELEVKQFMQNLNFELQS